MKYSLKEISNNEYEEFIESQDKGSPLQSTGWGKVKEENWEYIFVGLFDSSKTIVMASIVLIRKLFYGLKMAYLPRGPISNIISKDMMSSFTTGMKVIMKKYGVAYYVIDPICIYKSFSCGQHEDQIYNPWKNNEDFIFINNIFTMVGLKHNGLTKNMSEAIQPRINVMVPLAKNKNSFLALDDLRKTFNKRTKESIGNFHTKRGISFEKVESNNENIHILSQFVQMTADKKSINLRNEEYFKRICSYMGEDASIYFAYCNIDTYIGFLTEKKDKSNNKDIINRQINELEALKLERGNRIIVSAMLHAFPPNRTGIRIADYLYSGTNTSISAFKNLQIASGLMYFTMGDCINRKCQFLNLGGINNTEDDDLFKFKSRFNSIVLEYGGEWNGIISNWKYLLISKIMPIAKKIVSKMR